MSHTSSIVREDHQQHSTDEQQKGSTSNQPNKSNTIFAHNQGIRLRLPLAQCHLWVSNIAKETHASDLKEIFSKHGKVRTDYLHRYLIVSPDAMIGSNDQGHWFELVVMVRLHQFSQSG